LSRSVVSFGNDSRAFRLSSLPSRKRGRQGEHFPSGQLTLSRFQFGVPRRLRQPESTIHRTFRRRKLLGARRGKYLDEPDCHGRSLRLQSLHLPGGLKLGPSTRSPGRSYRHASGPASWRDRLPGRALFLFFAAPVQVIKLALLPRFLGYRKQMLWLGRPPSALVPIHLPGLPSR